MPKNNPGKEHRWPRPNYNGKGEIVARSFPTEDRALGFASEVYDDGLLFDVYKKAKNKYWIVVYAKSERYSDNPEVLIFGGNPGEKGGRVFSTNVHEIRYTHSDDGKKYKHSFGKGVCMVGLPNGSVVIHHKDPNKRVWEEM